MAKAGYLPCPRCGEPAFISGGGRTRANGSIYRQRQCTACGHKFSTDQQPGQAEQPMAKKPRQWTCPNCRHLAHCKALPPAWPVACETLLPDEPHPNEIEPSGLTLQLPIRADVVLNVSLT